MKLGIIGLGTVGDHDCRGGGIFSAWKWPITTGQKADCPYPYMEKADLLSSSDVILTSIPRNQIVMEKEDFDQMGKLFINVGSRAFL